MKAEILYKDSVIGTISNGQTISLHCADKVLTDDIVVRAVKEQSGYTLTLNQTSAFFSFYGIDTETANNKISYGSYVIEGINEYVYIVGDDPISVSSFSDCTYTLINETTIKVYPKSNSATINYEIID